VKYLLLEVQGQREYRGHHPGDRFVTKLDAALERGIARGNVIVIAEVEPELQEGRYRLPDDWPQPAADAATTEAPKGASLIGEGGKKQ
jgi:hypothetical protein